MVGLFRKVLGELPDEEVAAPYRSVLVDCVLEQGSTRARGDDGGAECAKVFDRCVDQVDGFRVGDCENILAMYSRTTPIRIPSSRVSFA